MTVIAAMSAQATIPVEQAVGMVLPHDITEIVRDSFKGRAFKKGHIIREQDVDHLRRLGKEHIYVLRLGPDEIHENEAALQLAEALADSGVGYATEVVEGKVSLRATADGLLRVDREALFRFNLLGEVMCATLQDHTPVREGEVVAASRLIPLVWGIGALEYAIWARRAIRRRRAAAAGLDPETVLAAIYTAGEGEGLVLDAVLATSEAQRQASRTAGAFQHGVAAPNSARG